MCARIRPDRVLTVRPALPEALRGLHNLAYNLWWSWNPSAQDVFRRIDPDIWQATQRNPVALLAAVRSDQLAARASDPAFVADLQRVTEQFDRYMHTPSWFERSFGGADTLRVAYFSMEYGVTESVPLYSGGLGVLAGDHIKAASDLGVPVVGVGMLYRQGYFRQVIDPAGQQRERFPDNDFYGLPVRPQLDAAGEPVTIQVALNDHDVSARLWRMDVGRVPIIFLDADLPANSPADRELTAKLYQGDADVRLRQEMLLGIGGMRALEALDMRPSVAHMNEGHSAFLVLERLRALADSSGLSGPAVRHIVGATTVFTTHTPVPAGHDEFSAEQIDQHLARYLREIGLTPEDLMRLGRTEPDNSDEPFGMTVLAMREAASRNGVSDLHGAVSRKMWRRLWPQVPVHEVPIGHVTNGIHLRSWVSRELAELFERYVGPDWAERTNPDAIAAGIEAIPGDELWRVHVRRRERLITNVRRRLAQQAARRWGSRDESAEAAAGLHADVLTIGFARRIALYKRPTLLLHDLDRLRRLLTNTQRPVQVIFAGKAHPRDQLAKDLVYELTALGSDSDLQGRVVFIEDYDMSLSRDLVQGCDVWLNTPIPPQEASGTSGMKAAANGVLNLSVLDGWWAEAYRPAVGWAIGRGDTDDHTEQRDASDASALYYLLERSVVPAFYDVGAEGFPAEWVRMARAAMILAATRLSAGRMVREYTERYYHQAHQLGRRLAASHGARASELAGWLSVMRERWEDVRVVQVECDGQVEHDVGAKVPIRARVALGGLAPHDLAVQVCVGRVDPHGSLDAGQAIDAEPDVAEPDGSHWFQTRVHLGRSGQVGLAVRVVPRHDDLMHALDTGLVRWSGAEY